MHKTALHAGVADVVTTSLTKSFSGVGDVLAGSAFLRRDDPNNVQDPYTLRCVPQVHGAVRDSIAYAQWVIDIELNTVNDNPIIFVDDAGEIDVVSAGNFHGEPVALAMASLVPFGSVNPTAIDAVFGSVEVSVRNVNVPFVLM